MYRVFFFMNEKHLEDLLKSGNTFLKPKHKNVLRGIMLIEQKFLCKVCGKDLKEEKNSNRHMDHDHKSKLVRGVLCATCNMVLGKIERAGYSQKWLHNLAGYLDGGSHPIVYPEKITAKRKTKKVEMKQLIDDNSWEPQPINT